jgi:hypothetical protein
VTSTVSQALDPNWLTANLSPHLWRDDEVAGEVIRVEIRDTWVSLQGLTTLYEIHLRGRDDGVARQLYVGHEVIPEHFDREYETLVRTATAPPRLGRPVVPVVEANLILLAFPNARKMQPLSPPDLGDWLRPPIDRLLATRLGRGTWHLKHAAVDVINYVPDRRLTMRCRCQVVVGDSDRSLSFIAKQFSSSKKATRLYRNLTSLDRGWRSPSVRFPKPLGFDRDHAVVFMEEVPGTDLRRSMSDIALGELLRTAGRLLAAFHRAPVRVRRTVSARSELEAVNGALRIVTRTFPEMRKRARACLSALKGLQWSDDGAAVLLHGAYRLSHILEADGELALVDLDSMRIGHPAYDLGKFLAYLYYRETSGQLTALARRNGAYEFLEGYLAVARWRVSPAAVLWFLASELINKQTKKDIARPGSDGSERVEGVLRLSEAALAAARSSAGRRLSEVCAAIP